MKKRNKIHSLRSLNEEIAQLQTEAKNTERKLEENFDYFRDNAMSFFTSSFFCRSKNKEEKNEKHAFFGSERFGGILGKMADHVAEKAVNGVDSILNRFFHKKE
jgi:hypothetical protein